MTNRKKLTLLALAAALITGVAVWAALKPMSGPVPRERLTIVGADRPAFALLYVAHAKGYFREEGVEVSFLRPQQGTNTITTLADEKADLATLFETPIIERSFAGDPPNIITTLSSSRRNAGLLALNDRGISKLEDLKGKKIGISRNTNGEFFLFLLLSSEGIKTSQVQLVDMRSNEIAQAIAGGRVDAVATLNPYLYEAEAALKGKKTAIFYSDLYFQTAFLVAKPKTVAERRTALVALLRAVATAEDFTRKNEREVIDIVARYIPDYPKEPIKTFWNDFVMEAKLDNVTLHSLNQRAKWMSSLKTYPSPVPDFRTIIISDYLREANPAAVTIRAGVIPTFRG
jgi:ABC-type nitrate/sulfonate/bicarbonate transport system substrate-binding protein